MEIVTGFIASINHRILDAAVNVVGTRSALKLIYKERCSDFFNVFPTFALIGDMVLLLISTLWGKQQIGQELLYRTPELVAGFHDPTL